MMTRSIQYIVIFCSLALGMGSCNYLDVVPDNIPNIDHAFNDRDAAEKFLFTCYNRIPQQAKASDDPAMLGGNELYTYKGEGEMNQTLLGLINGNQNPGNPIFNSWSGGNNANPLFHGIRDCNIFLEKVYQVYDIQPMERERWIAEVKFLKAYYHFYLFRMYGAIPIVDKNFEVSEEIGKMGLYRQPVDSCIQYIDNLIREAVPFLPLKITKIANELGRITQPIALAVRAQLWMLAASPLFNGNADYAGISDNRGVELFCASEDPKKWETAARACKAAIDTAILAGNELYELPSDPFPLNNEFRKELTLRMIIFDKWNKETIWGQTRFSSHEMSHLCMPPVSTTKRDRASGRFVPTFDMVDTYYTQNGVPMNEDKDFPYDQRYSLKTATAQEKWYIKEGETTIKLHFNREPRFYASIGFDRGIWLGQDRKDYNNYNDLWVVRARQGERCGFIASKYYSITGYFSKKLVDYRATVSDESDLIVEDIPFPAIRLADLYLLYAEALNETKKAPDAEVFKYIDEVRKRAGLEGVEKSWTEHSKRPDRFRSKEGMRDIIHQERMIELAMEGHTFWDLRRWKKAEEYFNRPIRGWNLKKKEPDEYYKQVFLLQRVYGRKNYLWPIKNDEIRNNPKTVQNYGW